MNISNNFIGDSMAILKIGVIGSSRKKDERRYPIHPEHIKRIPENIRKNLIFETGYGQSFGIDDVEIEKLTGGVSSRHELLAELGVVIILKPTCEDLEELKIGGLLWGYVHCDQQADITQTAIDRKQTLIAFEDMNAWGSKGEVTRHTFYKNNEMAGYCAVLHALQLCGIDGHYGNQRKTTIFGFGAVSRGAIYALKAHGFRDITICIQRPDHEVREEVLDCHYVHIQEGNSEETRMVVIEHDGQKSPLNNLIQKSDIIINGIFQDVSNPIDLIKDDEVGYLKSNSLIIDVSCDEGMGFSFAKPTTFRNPVFKINDVTYYAVDHTPSYLWESATRSISAALITHLPDFITLHDSRWESNKTIFHALNIENGEVIKPSVLKFQNREITYPHEIKSVSLMDLN